MHLVIASLKRICFLLTTFLFTNIILAQVTVNSFSPSSGPVGTIVEILGSGFDTTTNNNIVYFGGAKVEVMEASSTLLKVKVLPGVTYQPITVTANNSTGYSNSSFILSFENGNNPADSASFDENVDFNAGNYPQHLVVGDYDGDGRVDVAVANYGTGFIPETTIGVFRNLSEEGSVLLDTKVDYTAGKGPYNIASGDINADGKLDLVVANANDATISIFLNTSYTNNIVFNLIFNSPVGGVPESVAINDMNADGKPDIMVACAGESKVYLLRNTSVPEFGLISFSQQAQLSVLGSISLVAGDIDGDSKPDIAVANGGNTVWVLRNISSKGGDLQFDSRLGFTTGSGCYQVSVSDLDHDGKLDLITPNDFDSSVSILKNISTPGNISFDVKQDHAVGFGPLSLAVADINGDGKPDVAVANTSDASFSVLTNTSINESLSFYDHTDYFTNPGPKAIAVADIDGDGRNDILTVNADKTLSIYKNKIEVVLPLTLLNFTGQADNNTILLKWLTLNEKAISRFIIERSPNGNLFTPIGTMATLDNVNLNKLYSFKDATPLEQYNYYRLKIVDNDGEYTFSNIIRVHLGIDNVAVFPNPTSNFVIIQHPIFVQRIAIKVFDVTGKVVKSFYLNQNTSQTKIDLGNLPKGVYKLFWTTGLEKKSRTIVLQ